MKKIITAVTAIIILAVLSVSIVIMKKYTDILGAPEYLYMDDCPVIDFKKVDETYELELWDPSQYTLKQLKYCSNLKKLTIITSQLENLDFISDLEITDLSICIWGECRDWSKISTLTHLKYLDIYRSDFNDVSLLREMSELETLCISGYETVDISHIGELPKLNKLSICVQNDDISDISKCTQLTSLSIFNCTNVKDISFLKDMDNIEYLFLQWLDIEDYSFLTEMENLKTVEIYNIPLGDEIIKELQDKGVDLVEV